MTRIPALATVLALALCATAPAATTVQLDRGPGPVDGPAPTIVGPQPAGAGLAYGYGTPAAGFDVAVATPGAAPRVIGRVPASIQPTLGIAASSGLVAVSRVDIDCREEFACHYEPAIVATDLALGPPTGPLQRVDCPSGCGLPPACIQRSLMASAVALLVRSGCNGGSVVFGPAGTSDLGAVLAAISDRSVAIARRPLGRPADQVSVAGLDGTPRFVVPAVSALADLAIDAADTVAQWDGRTLSLSTAAQPAPRAVLSLGGTGTLVGAGGRRFAVAQSLGERRGQRITVVEDTGAVVARTDLPASATAPGFDGARLTFAVPRCAATILVSLPVGEPLPALGSPCARPGLRTRTATLTTKGTLPLSFTCPRAAATGCAATLRVTGRRRHLGRRENGAARVYQLRTAALRLDPGERGTLRTTVSTGGQRWLRRHRGDLDVVVALGARRTRVPLRVSAGR